MAALPLYEVGATLYRVTVQLVRDVADLPAYDGSAIRGPSDVRALASALLDSEAQEVFVAFLLDTRHRVNAYHIVTRGIVDASLVHPREVFRAAILANASAVIVAHNHPSGDPSPSQEDRAVTRVLAEAGKVVGIPLLDHVVVGGGTGTYVSLANEIT